MPAVHETLEPRLAAVEVQIETVTRDISSLTEDIKSLANSMRTHGENIELQMRQLHIAVTNAAAPKKADLNAIFAAILVVMAIGAAVVSPIYLQMTAQQDAIKDLQQHFEEHGKLTLHPVGASRIDALEKAFERTLAQNVSDVKELAAKLERDNQRNAEALEERIRKVNDEGAPITRERLAVIELQLQLLQQARMQQ